MYTDNPDIVRVVQVCKGRVTLALLSDYTEGIKAQADRFHALSVVESICLGLFYFSDFG